MRDPLPREPDSYKDLNAVSITSAAAVWTPAATKLVRLMGGAISVSAAGSVVFTEETSGTVLYRTPTLLANVPYPFDLYNTGRYTATAGKKVMATLSVAGTITGMIWGEEVISL